MSELLDVPFARNWRQALIDREGKCIEHPLRQEFPPEAPKQVKVNTVTVTWQSLDFIASCWTIVLQHDNGNCWVITAIQGW